MPYVGKEDRRQYLKQVGVTSATIGLAGCLGNVSSSSGSYPNNSVELIVPYGQGGGTDTYARKLMPKMSDILGESININNVEGVAGLRGTREMMKSEPNGYTFGATPNPPAEILADLLNESDINLRDISFLGGVGVAPWVIYTNKKYDVSSFEALLEKYRSSEFKTIGTQSPGSQSHILASALKNDSKYDMQWENFVAYQGTGPISKAVISNEVPVGFGTDSAVASVESEVNLVAVLTSAGSKIFPDLPTVTDLGYPNIDYIGQFTRGYGVTPDTDSEHVNTLRDALKETVNSDQIQSWSEESGNPVGWLGGEEYLSGLVNDAYDKIPKVVDLESLKQQ